jgi:transposase-like protein
MPRCPLCDSPRIVIVLNRSRRGLCAECGARWIQDGDTQRHIETPSGDQRAGAR